MLIFLHIPKTAGVSFYTVIEQQFPNSSIFYQPSWSLDDLRILRSSRKLLEIKAIIGHIAYRDAVDVFPDARFVTFIRDPFERTYSSYRFLSSEVENPDHKKVKQLSFSDFIEAGIAGQNLQFDQLASVGPEVHLGWDLKRVDDEITRIFNSIDYIGLVEFFPECLKILGHKFSWDLDPHVWSHRSGQKRNKNDLSSDNIKKICELNWKDYALYGACVNKFVLDRRS